MLPFSWRRLFLDNVKDELTALLLGLTGGSLYFIVENYALAYGYCSNVSLIVCLTPLVTAIIVGWRYPAERLGKAGIAGSLVALAGMALVVFNGNFVLRLSPLGDVLALAACLCWALYSLLIKPLGARYDNMLITRKVFGYGLLTIIPLLLWRGMDIALVIEGGAAVWGNILFLGVVASMLCFLGWNWCLERIGTVRATNLLYLNPVVAITTSSLFLGERVTWIALAGAVLILCGLLFMEKNHKK
jgi:drug/metabolite transporter (DMT)-like permease